MHSSSECETVSLDSFPFVRSVLKCFHIKCFFFRWQTKPRMTIHGDLYYEGKEFETRLKEKKPGDLSEELRTALGMPIGPNCHKIPPPWLIAQQRFVSSFRKAFMFKRTFVTIVSCFCILDMVHHQAIQI